MRDLPRGLIPSLRGAGLERPFRRQAKAEFGSVIQSQPLKGEKASDLTAVFPQFRTIGPCGYDLLTIDAQTQADLSLSGAGQVIWFCFEELELADVVGAECTLYGAMLTLSSVAKTPDAVNRPFEAQIGWDGRSTFGAGGSNPSHQAAIVIGEKLPVTTQNNGAGFRAWTAAKSNIPGIDPGLGFGAQYVDRRESRYFHYEYFPVGDYFAASCQRQITRPVFAPYVHRFPYGRKVQVALVCRNDTFAGVASLGNDLFIYGQVSVSLLVGLTKNDQTFTNE